jgi:hypothetical protein
VDSVGVGNQAVVQPRLRLSFRLPMVAHFGLNYDRPTPRHLDQDVRASSFLEDWANILGAYFPSATKTLEHLS